MADIAASTSTTASIGVGGTVQGALEVAGDHDWYRISLVAGQQITISLSGTSGPAGVSDTYLNLRNSAGTILMHNDDSGGSLNSKIVFTVTTTGTYYIDAGAWDASSLADGSNQPAPGPNAITGNYVLSVQNYAPPPVFTYDQIANQLVTGYWQASGTSPHHFNVHQGGTITVNYSTLSAAEQTLAIAALGEWSDIIGVTFTPVTTGGQIVFDDSEDPSAGGPVAQTDGHWSGGIISSSHVQISSSWVQRYGSGLNSYSFMTYLHEIGHALGLGHAGDYNNTADYASDALYANDAWSTTIMSYFDQSDNAYFAGQGFSKQFVLTPMDGDIAAMQQMYGLSTTTRTGNTTYGFNSNAGSSIYNAQTMGALAYTVFDSGGVDTLNYSGFTSNQLINLNPETFSNVGTGIGNVSIARGTVIENAIGGSGNDTIIGNSVDNVITGGSGIDKLTGGAGNDTFQDTLAGLNGDTITDFSAGDKIVVTNGSLSTFTFNLTGTTLTINGSTVVHLGSAPGGTITASALASGGVQLSVGSAIQTAIGHSGDFNGDGHDDILLRNDDGRVTLWLGSANGAFADTNNYRIIDTHWQIAAVGDFNGDTRDDILWHNDDGRVTTWLGTSTGSFSDTNTYRTVDLQWQIAGSGDFNGDGRSDILWHNTDGRITLWLGTNNGAFSDTNTYRAVGTDWQVAGTADFNGDGITDLLWRNTDGRVTEWLGSQSGVFSDTNIYKSVDPLWHVVGIGDFNGDSLADILWRNEDGRVTEWLGNGAGTFADTNLYRLVDPHWQVASIGHFNGDATDDVVWQNADGRVTEWLGSTGGWFSETNTYRAVDFHWHVQPTGDFTY